MSDIPSFLGVPVLCRVCGARYFAKPPEGQVEAEFRKWIDEFKCPDCERRD